MQRKRMAVTVYQDAGLQARRAVDDALKLIRREPVQQYDWVPFELVTDRMSTTHFSKIGASPAQGPKTAAPGLLPPKWLKSPTA